MLLLHRDIINTCLNAWCLRGVNGIILDAYVMIVWFSFFLVSWALSSEHGDIKEGLGWKY